MRSDDAYDYAWDNARRNADGSRVLDSMVELLADVVDFDAAEARKGLARRIIARRKRPGQTAPEGSVVFPGMEMYAYEPNRLVSDDEGNVTENRHARAKHKAAEANRAQADARKAVDRASREQREQGHFAVWSAEQYEAGRDPREITWDTCVHETGLWKDALPEDSDDELEDDE